MTYYRLFRDFLKQCTSVPHQFYAALALAPRTKFDTVPAPNLPTLFSMIKRTEINIRTGLCFRHICYGVNGLKCKLETVKIITVWDFLKILLILNIDSKPEPSEPEQLESELHQFRAPALAK
jgi:hypothetical protein